MAAAVVSSPTGATAAPSSSIEEREVAAAVVFQCAHCRRIIG
jgi:hypothetical protein